MMPPSEVNVHKKNMSLVPLGACFSWGLARAPTVMEAASDRAFIDSSLCILNGFDCWSQA